MYRQNDIYVYMQVQNMQNNYILYVRAIEKCY